MFFVLIYGWKIEERVVAEGSFNCPNCRVLTNFRQLRTSKFRTIFFIPTYAMESYGEMICCCSCNMRFDPMFKTYTAEQILHEFPPWRCDLCGRYNSGTMDWCGGCRNARENCRVYY